MGLLLERSVFGSESDRGKVMELSEAEALLNEWVGNEKLKVHMRQVAALMKAWAQKQGYIESAQHAWYIAGLLHDADWDRWPEQHCKKIIEELEIRHTDPVIMHAIASHGPAHFGVEPVSEMDKMLYAFDELSGFVHAYSLVREQGYAGMDTGGVKKRLKQKGFAAQVSREDIADGALRAGLTQDELIQFVIEHQKNL